MASYLRRDEFEGLLTHFRKFDEITVDTEGTLNHPFSQTWGLSISAGGVGDYFAFKHKIGANLPIEWLPELRDLLLTRKCLDFHHAKHDLRSLRSLGIDYQGKFHCTMLMSHMTDENRYSQELDSLSKLFGGDPKRNGDVMKALGEAFGWENIPVEAIRDYGFNDAYITEELKDKLAPDFEAQGFNSKLWDIEQDFTRTLADMEDTGILIDQSFCEQELERGTKIMNDVKNELGFNPGSSNELGEYLLGELELPILKRSPKTQKPSFDKETMEKYEEILEAKGDSSARQILTYRGWSKSTGSNYRPYLEKVSPDGRFRTNFKQHGTVSGRLSASILQQIPKTSKKDWNGRLKEAFIATPGWTLWDFDYSQIEFRVMAAYAKELSLLEIFNDDTRDIFNEMALELAMERDPVKTLNYTIAFGGGFKRISRVFGINPMAAKGIRNRYYKRYPRLLLFKNLCQQRADENGFVQYWSGRRRHFMFESEHHKAQNSVIQGGAFEIVKRQTLAVKKAGLITDECKLVLQVHDDVVFEIMNSKEHIYVPEIKRVLEDVKPKFGVKFRVDAHKWGTKESWGIAV